VPFLTLYHEQIVESLWNNYQIDLHEIRAEDLKDGLAEIADNVLED
jgi:hypothetical protein